MGDVLASVGLGLIVSAVPAIVAWAFIRSVVLDVLSDALLIAGNLLLGAGALMQGNLYGAAAFAVAAWVAWHMWRRWKRRRDRAPRSYGYKARAALAALVRHARESAKPRPVLRPQPGGAQ